MKGMSRSILAIGLTTLMLVAAACGDDDDSSSGSNGGGASTSAEAAKPKIKVGLVTDIGGLNDRGFNQLANDGLERAKKELGVDGRVITSSKNSDYIPNLGTFGQQGYDLIIGNGFLMGDAVATSARRFPKSKFAIIDFSQAAMKGKPTNAEGLVFKEQESGYSQDFVDQAKCKELALNQIGRGSKVVFAAAGQCGLGAIDAAKERDVQAIGVDNDQSFLGPQVITSATKKVDVAVYDAIKAAQDGTFKGGTDNIFDVKNGGMGVGKFSAAGQKYASQIED